MKKLTNGRHPVQEKVVLKTGSIFCQVTEKKTISRKENLCKKSKNFRVKKIVVKK